MSHSITSRKYVQSKICPVEKVSVEKVSVEKVSVKKVSVENMSVEKTSRCQKNRWIKKYSLTSQFSQTCQKLADRNSSTFSFAGIQNLAVASWAGTPTARTWLSATMSTSVSASASYHRSETKTVKHFCPNWQWHNLCLEVSPYGWSPVWMVSIQ